MQISTLFYQKFHLTKLSLSKFPFYVVTKLTWPNCHYQIVIFVNLQNCHYEIVVTILSPYQIVITKLSLTNCHYQIVITKLSLPNCLYQIVITKKPPILQRSKLLCCLSSENLRINLISFGYPWRWKSAVLSTFNSHIQKMSY